MKPGEVIISDALYAEADLAPLWRSLPAVMPLARDVFDGATAERRLTSFFAVATSEAFGTLSRLELTAAAACVTYVERTQLGNRPPLSPPLRESVGATMAIDQATRANLELMRTLAGERRGSLLECIDRCVTAAGSRLLAQRLSAPLTDPAAIARRLDAVTVSLRDAAARAETRSRLAAAPDLARALSRLVVERGGPRDLAAIRDGVLAAAELARALAALKDMPAEIADALKACLAPDGMLAAELSAALAAELPAFKRDGGFVREGYDAALDETRALRDESRRVVAALQARYAEDTGIRGLKIRHNNVLGYFVEVTAQHGDKLMAAPHSATFIHRQTLAGQVRFTSTELGELEAKIASAAERALGIELDIFEKLSAAVTAQSAEIKQCAEALAALDVASALAALAVERDYVRPVVDHSLAFVIDGGRHPVVEQALARDGTPFVANACDLSPPKGEDAGRIWLITGPNMAGKSTFLRQNALIAILAQMGSFVPAKAAHIGVVDRLFSRVGAADDLARGRSTFMVEMVETAAILNQASPRSLVILDEIGRGTATFDGLSIAWATVEHLHDVNKCRALFATHFHELTALSARPCPPAQCHRAGEGMAGRRGVPARGRARLRRPLLRHPGRQARRAAAERHRARQAGAGQAGTGRPRQAQRLRGPAAVCGDSGAAANGSGRGVCACRRCYRRAQSRRDVAARGDGRALCAEAKIGDQREEVVAQGTRQVDPAFAGTTGLGQAMMNVADRKHATAPADAKRWLDDFAAALQAQDAKAAAAMFLPDGLWRDVLAFTWTIETASGRAAIEETLRRTLARTQPKNFHIPPNRTPPRWVARAGTECIEAIFEFDTAFGPGNGVLRLVARPARDLARLDAEDEFARIARPRRGVQAPRPGRGQRLARFRRRQLARPPRRGARLCRP